MYFTFSLRDAAVLALIAVTIIFVIYLIRVMKRLIVTLEKSNRILDDIETITDIAEKRTVDVDNIVDGVASAAVNLSTALKGEETLIKQLSVIAHAISNIVGMIRGRKPAGNTEKACDEKAASGADAADDRDADRTAEE